MYSLSKEYLQFVSLSVIAEDNRLGPLSSILSLKGVNSQHNVMWSLWALSIIASVCTHTKLKLQKNWHDSHFTHTFYLSNTKGQEKSVLPDSHKNLEIKLYKGSC